MILLATWSQISSAQIALGTTKAVWNAAGFGTLSAANTSIAGDGSTIWPALESLESPAALEPQLSVLRLLFPWAAVSMKVLQPTGDLVADGMYPSIVTWPGAVRIHVTGKVDNVAPNFNKQIRVYGQNRNNFAIAAEGPLEVTPTDTLLDHGRPHLAYGPASGDRFLCWTDKNATVEHVNSKVKDQATWLASTEHIVSATADVEDHCYQAFWTDGARYTVYHRNGAGDDIFLEITTWNGTTWSEPVADFQLQGSADADFPAIWISASSILNGSKAFIVAKSSNPDNILFWECAGVRTACDSSGEFGVSTTISAGGDHFDPKPFAMMVPDSFPAEHNVYVVYQKQALPRKVKLLKRCAGAATFTEIGSLPLPASYGMFQHEELGANLSSRTRRSMSMGRQHTSVFWRVTTLPLPKCSAMTLSSS